MKKLITIVVGLVAMTLQAQVSKQVSLADKVPYADQIALKGDTTKVTASFVFDESANTISVTLKSERKLFVFWDEITYRKAFHCRRLRTDRLSYALTSNTADEFHSARHFRRRLPKPRCKYLFHAWFSAENMEAAKAERKILNDSITQLFTVSEGCIEASIRLRDILLIDEVKEKGIAHYYELSYGGDINTVYTLSLQRNPCIGLDREIQAAQSARTAVQQSYQSFKSIFDKGIVNSAEGEQLFHDLQDALQTQFPVYQDSSACSAVQQAYGEYNQWIDSIRSLSVTLQNPVAQDDDRSLNSKTVLANARQIDSNVARWLVTTDKMEKADLVDQCKNIIADTSEMIQKNGTRTAEERNAAEVFRKAEQFFRRTCR